jgi:uncharacterized protein (TIRG00374 family)
VIKHPAKPSRRRLIVGIVIGLIIIGLIVVALDWHEVKKILGETDWKLVPVALLFTAISYTCLSFGFATANRIFGIRLRWRDLSEIGFVSVVLNHLISAGGAAGYSVRFLLMGDQGASVRDILAASLFNSYLDSMGMLALLPIGMGYLFVKHPLGPGMTVVVGVSAVLLVILSFLGTALVFIRSLRTAVLRAIGRAGRFVTRRDFQSTLKDFDDTMTRAVAVLHTRPLLLFLMIALVVFDWASSVAALWFCFDALGDPIPLGVLLTGFTLGITAGAVSMVPGGLGIQDGSMAGLYALLGVPLQKAVLASILFRLVYYLVPYLVSLVFYGRLLRQVGRTDTQVQIVEEG